MEPPRPRRLGLLVCALVALATVVGPLGAHPVPDVPFRVFLHPDAGLRIELEVDVRCLAADPGHEPYFVKSALDALDETARARLLARAGTFAKRAARFEYRPAAAAAKSTPDFEFSFTAANGAPLAGDEDPVMMTGHGKLSSDATVEAFRLISSENKLLSTVLEVSRDGGASELVAVLFPGEASRWVKVSDGTRFD